MRLGTEYVRFLLEVREVREMRNSTIGKQLSFLKWFLRWSLSQGMHRNNAYDTFRPKLKDTQKKLIDACSKEYDYVIIDCPPVISLLTLNALIASTDVIIPIEADGFALHGIVKLGSVIDQIHTSVNTQLQILGLLITKFNKRKTLSRDVEGRPQNSP